MTATVSTQANHGSQRAAIFTVFAIAAAHFLLHFFTNGNYGMFRDEFYYIACSDHLAWGFVDHPPLSILILAGSRALLGDSIGAVRLTVAIAGAVAIIGSALLARELGGKRFAQILAALAVAISPLYLGIAGFFSMNAFDLLFWLAAYFLMARTLRTGRTHLLLILGVIVGFGLMNKYNMFTCALGLAMGLLLVPQRRWYKDWRLWLGGAVAAVIFLPHLIWQIQNGWPTLEFIENAKRYKIASFGIGEFLAAQILQIHPLNLPIWLIGLVSLLGVRRFETHRSLGIAFLVSLIFLMAQRSKTYYIGPAFPVLLAAGTCALEASTNGGKRRWLRPALFVLLLAGGIVTLPFSVPVFSPEKLIGYQQALRLRAASEETGNVGVLDQHFADRFGWETMVHTLTSVYRGFPEDDRERCVILAGNYGEAGAIDYYGTQFGLPKAISGHNNYFLWGPGETSGEIVISVGIHAAELEALFSEVTVAAIVICPYAMPYETNLPIHVCRGLKIPLAEAWHRTRRFI
jgi:hypothetical protein